MNYTTAIVMMPLVEEPKSTRVTGPKDVYEFCKDLGALAQESFQILTLNGRNKVINRHMISLGMIDCSAACPREMFRAAILDSASGIICVHNHPTGETTPSSADIQTTKQLMEAGKLIGIAVLDHVIVGGENYTSLKESGLM